MRIEKLIISLMLIGSLPVVNAAPTIRRTQNNQPAATRAQKKSDQNSQNNQNNGATTPPKVIEIPTDKLLPAPLSLPSNLASYREIGHGSALVFTPDLAGAANRQFYSALGFFYLEEASWQVVIERISAYNATHRDAPITRLFIETHGNWGNGLKLQDGKEEKANRSYISIGALQERLEGSGVKECIISACNSGRLYRPEIYRKLDKSSLLPANNGVFNASKGYRPSPATAKILRRRESRFEAMTPLFVAEMPKQLRHLMEVNDGKAQINISDLFLEYVLHDPNLNLIEQGFVREISIYDYSVDRSEALILRFFDLLKQIATVETSREPVATSK